MNPVTSRGKQKADDLWSSVNAISCSCFFFIFTWVYRVSPVESSPSASSLAVRSRISGARMFRARHHFNPSLIHATILNQDNGTFAPPHSMAPRQQTSLPIKTETSLMIDQTDVTIHIWMSFSKYIFLSFRIIFSRRRISNSENCSAASNSFK